MSPMTVATLLSRRYDPGAMFIQQLEKDPFFFGCVVITVVISIVLHELAHGAVAIWQGDDTPIRLGRMTGNPLVHMGWFSLILLAVVGIAYGQMPVNPSRFRSRYGDALVAAAGPATNLVLALVALVVLGLWARFSVAEATQFQANAKDFLWCFGYINVALMMFNLLPIPPLDGSVILADFVPAYGRWARNPQYQGAFLFGLLFALFALNRVGDGLFGFAADMARMVLGWVRGF